MKISSTSAIQIHYFELDNNPIGYPSRYLNCNFDKTIEVNRELVEIIYED